jgi:hypothetical protein
MAYHNMTIHLAMTKGMCDKYNSRRKRISIQIL